MKYIILAVVLCSCTGSVSESDIASCTKVLDRRTGKVFYYNNESVRDIYYEPLSEYTSMTVTTVDSVTMVINTSMEKYFYVTPCLILFHHENKDKQAGLYYGHYGKLRFVWSNEIINYLYSIEDSVFSVSGTALDTSLVWVRQYVTGDRLE